MRLTRREFATALAAAPAMFLAACSNGGGGAPDVQEEPLPKYWVSETVEEGGVAYDLATFGLSTEEFFAIALNEDGTAELAAAGEVGGTATWKQSDGAVVLTAEGQEERLELKDNKLVFTMPYGNSELKVTLKSTETMPTVFSNGFDVLANLSPNLDIAQTLAMSNAALSARYVNDGDTLYGLHYDDTENGYAGLAAIKLRMSNGNIHVDSISMLDPECGAYHLTLHDGYIYYERYARGSNDCSICRLPVAGGEPEVLLKGDADFLQIHNGKLFYTNADHHFVTSDLDGKNEETIIAKECYYPYLVDTDYVIYQDDADGERFHIFHRPSGTDAPLTPDASYSPVVDGTTLWYTRKVEEGICHLVKMDLASYTAESGFATEEADSPMSYVVGVGVHELFAGEYVPGTNRMVARDNWKTLTQGDYASDKERGETVYLSQDYEIVREINANGNTSGLYINVPGSAIAFPMW